MKVLQLLLRQQIGGAETLAESLEEAWAMQGIDSTRVFLDSESESRSRAGRVRTLLNATRKMKPEAIVSHSAIPNAYARVFASVPVVAVLHSAHDDFDDPKLRWAEAWLWRRSLAIVAVSRAQARRYIERFPQAASRVHSIPNGVRKLSEATPVRAGKRYLVVTTARAAPQKDPELWASVAECAAAHVPEVDFEWWGPIDSPGDLLRSGATRLPHARFLGPTDRVGDVLAAADVYFHPSRREASSIGILEAASMGLPIVCSESVASTLPQAIVCLPFRDGDHIDAATRIAEVYASWHRWQGIALQNAEWVRRELAVESCARRYAELLTTASNRQVM